MLCNMIPVIARNDPTSVNGKGIANILASDVVDEVGKYTITLTDYWAGLLAVRFCYLDGDTTDDWEMTVVSEGVATNKTVVVQAERRITHPVYGKIMRRSKKYYAHDEKNEAKKGDKVVIAETRPLSKSKHWRLVEISIRAGGNEVAK